MNVNWLGNFSVLKIELLDFLDKKTTSLITRGKILFLDRIFTTSSVRPRPFSELP